MKWQIPRMGKNMHTSLEYLVSATKEGQEGK